MVEVCMSGYYFMYCMDLKPEEGREEKVKGSRKGHLHHFLDMVISDTYRISSGITFDVEDLVLKEVKFKFKKKNDLMILDYGNWS